MNRHKVFEDISAADDFLQFFRSNSPSIVPRYRRQSQSPYAAPAILHVAPNEEINSGDLCRRATFERDDGHGITRPQVNICLCYLDDIIVYAPNFQEHKRRLRKVLKCIQEAFNASSTNALFAGKKKLTIHLSPSWMNMESIQIPQKTAAVTKFPVPENVSDVQSFLACARIIGGLSKLCMISQSSCMIY
ncbi:hypothetical protein AVEN_152907-1 [Araneus ventricosus]|uniref:Reverse transcriptase domain-containing protein n=1 Tax=Araneus ventricosus TaxID=182803 RepID=A0A4Y2ACV1_ARAVE|nr:hypothetical protein AVEN_152907-1 [Araneus ventricosus]